jgi:hypothetical protein
MQGWIKRSFLDPQVLIRSLVNPLRDGIAMQRSRAVENFENQKVQRPLQTVILVFGHTKLAIYSWLIMALTALESQGRRVLNGFGGHGQA